MGGIVPSFNISCNQASNVNLENYFPVLLFLLVALFFGVFSLFLGRFLAPHRPDSEKLSPYECGFAPFENARMKFDVRFYLIAILFILFDLETAFLFPWLPPCAIWDGRRLSLSWFFWRNWWPVSGICGKKGQLNWE